MAVGNQEKNLFRKFQNFFANLSTEKLYDLGTCILNSDFFRFFSAALLIFLFISPISVAPLNLYEKVEADFLPRILAYRLPFDSNLKIESLLMTCLLWLIYLLPFAFIFSFATYFIERFTRFKLKKLTFVLSFSAYSAYIFCWAVCLISNANSWAWFTKVPVYIFIEFLLALLEHFLLILYGILSHRSANPEYVEYRSVRKEFSLKRHRLSVKGKFTFVIMGVICVILLSFMLLILNSYKKMFTEAVSDVGRAQAEHTAEIYDSADGKYEKIAAFFEEQRESNKYADTPFERIDIIVTYDKDSVYLEKWESSDSLPEFNIFAYTTGLPKEIDEGEKSLSTEQAVDYLKRFKSGEYKKNYVFNSENKTCKYIYPVTFSRKAGHWLHGFSIVTYKQQVLMRQYFRTKVFVLTIISVFIYLTVLLSVILSDYIFNPLLFLRKNVRKTSDSIEKVINGSVKDASGAIKFSETIKTNDEIKDLSLETGEMVNLIRGIMPFVSFSTLQHAEKIGDESKSRKRSTSARDLCFLFTDIRGFTSLCEGMSPKKVVDILNRYLDIETQIILDNGGDVDKFVGDEMMAFFSGPRKEINACKAAMEIRAAMREQQEISMEDGSTYVSIGIGINTGSVIFGSVGSQTRKDFTSIGDTVNLAARLEGANKAYGSKSIISEAVFQKLKDNFICRELDFITVKGKTEPVRIYEILQQKNLAEKNKASEKLNEIKNLFEKGLHFYRGQKWEESEKCFSECAVKYNDLPSVVFLDRIRHFKNNPPPKDWDGVFKMSVK